MLLVNMVIQINCTDAIINCIAIYMGIIASRDELGHLPCILQGCKVFILERVTLVISSWYCVDSASWLHYDATRWQSVTVLDVIRLLWVIVLLSIIFIWLYFLVKGENCIENAKNSKYDA